MNTIVCVALLVTGVIHLLPAVGMLGAGRLSALYGVEMSEPHVVLLMRHRAVLFGLLGLGLVLAAFSPPWQTPALLAGLVSVVSFLWLARAPEHYNAAIRRVFWADVLALACLLAGAAARLQALYLQGGS